jgi:hypothetical protein
MDRCTLIDGILYSLHLPSELRGLAVMLRDQLAERWRSFCESHGLPHPADADKDAEVPWNLVQQFMNDHLDWAKSMVHRRISQVLWPYD